MKNVKNDSTAFYLENICKKYSTTKQEVKVNSNCHIAKEQPQTITFIESNEEFLQNSNNRCMNKQSDSRSYKLSIIDDAEFQIM